MGIDPYDVPMSEHTVNLTAGLGATVLPEPPVEVRNALARLTQLEGAQARAAAAELAREHPALSVVWAAMGDTSHDVIERYAYYRVGYHRGLDALRANGWRGSGYVRWGVDSNRGFLRCLQGLAEMASEIGEVAEAERCALFLAQLDPSGPPVGS